jgi:hypothetical protein
MNTWNYRVVRHVDKVRDGSEYVSYAIHEAHYDTPIEVPHSITDNPVTTSFDTLDELRDALTKMLLGLDKPVLNYEDF